VRKGGGGREVEGLCGDSTFIGKKRQIPRSQKKKKLEAGARSGSKSLHSREKGRGKKGYKRRVSVVNSIWGSGGNKGLGGALELHLD